MFAASIVEDHPRRVSAGVLCGVPSNYETETGADPIRGTSSWVRSVSLSMLCPPFMAHVQLQSGTLRPSVPQRVLPWADH
jgi:hypothetical protein